MVSETFINKPKIVFFGTGPVAAKSLELLMSDFEIVAIVTKPKPDHHRGSFPVAELAIAKKIPLHTVRNRLELSELISRKPFIAEVAILIDFGIIVGQDVIDYFPQGIINSHFSLLPQWRGADPITFSILSGQKETGVSLMLLVEAMDEGPLVACGVQDISKTDTTATLTNKLISLSDALIKEELPHYLSKNKAGIEQTEMNKIITDYPAEPSYSRKITKDDGILDFNKSAITLEREIRAFISWPKSRTRLANIDVIITQAHALPSSPDTNGEEIVVQLPETLKIRCEGGYLQIDRLKPAGKKEMSAKEFIAGYGSRIKNITE